METINLLFLLKVSVPGGRGASQSVNICLARYDSSVKNWSAYFQLLSPKSQAFASSVLSPRSNESIPVPEGELTW